MHTLNLANYIRHGMIFKNLAQYELYDLIVYEDYESTYIQPSTEVTFKTILGDGLSLQPDAELAQLLLQHQHTLIVINTFPAKYIQQLVKEATNNLTILNLNAGVSGVLTKGNYEINDISLMIESGCSVHEPFDFVSLFALLQQEGKRYIRIPNKEFIGNLLGTANEESFENGLFDGTSKGLTGEDGTVLCSPSLLSEVMQVQSLKDAEKRYDIFGLTDYTFTPTTSLTDSLEKTGHLIAVLDQAQNAGYIDYLQHACLQAGFNDLDYTRITPATEGLNKLNVEDLYAQAGLDIIGLQDQLS